MSEDAPGESLVSHLLELRTRLLKAVGAVGVTFTPEELAQINTILADAPQV